MIDTTGQPGTALLMGATALPDISPNSTMQQVAQETHHEVLFRDPPDCHHCLHQGPSSIEVRTQGPRVIGDGQN